MGVHDNFFELGGSSLLGLQVVHQLRRALRLAVPLTVVYEGPTVRTLAQLVRESRAGFGTGAPAADSAPAADNAPAGEAAG